jgi:multidrug transporter EmrE-like cation transporter
MNPIVALLIAIALSTTGELLLKYGMNIVGSLELTGSQVLPQLFRTFTTPAVLGGFILIFGGSIFWLSVLSKSHLSWAYPMLSLGYVVVVGLSAVFLNEPLTLWRIAGVLTIIAGVFMVYRS